MQTAECLITFLGIVLLPALWHEQRNQECRPPPHHHLRDPQCVFVVWSHFNCHYSRNKRVSGHGRDSPDGAEIDEYLWVKVGRSV